MLPWANELMLTRQRCQRLGRQLHIALLYLRGHQLASLEQSIASQCDNYTYTHPPYTCGNDAIHAV